MQKSGRESDVFGPTEVQFQDTRRWGGGKETEVIGEKMKGNKPYVENRSVTQRKTYGDVSQGQQEGSRPKADKRAASFSLAWERPGGSRGLHRRKG